MSLFAEGEKIEGDKIYYRFGGINYKTGKPCKGDLTKNGYAFLDVPLKKSSTGDSKSRPRLSCNKAVFECAKVKDMGKVHGSGAHRHWHGFLKGSASCEIKIPRKNIPDSKDT